MTISFQGQPFYRAEPVPKSEESAHSVEDMLEELREPYGFDGNYRREFLLAASLLARRWQESTDSVLTFAQNESDCDAKKAGYDVLAAITLEGEEASRFLVSALERLSQETVAEVLGDMAKHRCWISFSFVRACLGSGGLGCAHASGIAALIGRTTSKDQPSPALLIELVGDAEMPRPVRLAAARTLSCYAECTFGDEDNLVDEVLRWWSREGRYKSWG